MLFQGGEQVYMILFCGAGRVYTFLQTDRSRHMIPPGTSTITSSSAAKTVVCSYCKAISSKETDMRYKYCPECGTKLIMKEAGDDGLTPYCENCDKMWFDAFSSAVIVLTFNEFDEVVMARQSYINKDYAILTSGFISPGENAEETALREVKEELGLDIEELIYAGTHWFPRNELLMHGFLAFTHKKELTLSPEVDSAEWTPLADVDKVLVPDAPGNTARKIYRRFLKYKGIL